MDIQSWYRSKGRFSGSELKLEREYALCKTRTYEQILKFEVWSFKCMFFISGGGCDGRRRRSNTEGELGGGVMAVLAVLFWLLIFGISLIFCMIEGIESSPLFNLDWRGQSKSGPSICCNYWFGLVQTLKPVRANLNH